MLKIAEVQMRVLDRMMRDDATKSLCGMIRSHLPELIASVDDAALERRVATALSTAEQMGVCEVEATAQLAAIVAVMGAEFVDVPEIEALLYDPSATPEERVAALIAAFQV